VPSHIHYDMPLHELLKQSSPRFHLLNYRIRFSVNGLSLIGHTGQISWTRNLLSAELYDIKINKLTTKGCFQE
jgi:hypothetical protein